MDTEYKSIVGVIDAQGYFFKNTFYPREFSFTCGLFNVCYEVIPDWDDSVIDENYNYIRYQKHSLHGLPTERILTNTTSGVIQQSQLRDFVLFLYKSAKLRGESTIAVKNYQLVDFLRPLQFPIYDLSTQQIEGELCPTLDTFDKFHTSYHCPLHAKGKHARKYRCSARKTKCIWEWIKLKKESSFQFDNYDIAFTLRQNALYSQPDDIGEDTVF
jgi:hypothetical protein